MRQGDANLRQLHQFVPTLLLQPFRGLTQHLAERGKPSECAWDVLQPANDVYLPPNLARTSDLEALAARLAHVEKYLRTLPPNLAPFRPLDIVPVVPKDRPGEVSDARGGGKKRKMIGALDDEAFSDVRLSLSESFILAR